MSSATSVRFDPRLMQRYDREGPRYTSYPTARQFHDRLAPDAYQRAAAASPGAVDGSPLSLYVHVPFCASPCFYCGCNKVVSHRFDRIDAYMEHLLGEIALRSVHFDRTRVVEQMHFGGGTPTHVTNRSLAAVIECIGRHFTLTTAESRDYSIEIDPRSVDGETLRLLADLGFNRVSLGVQDFDEHVQRAVNRLQPPAMVESVHETLRGLGFRSINFDLIYGLPLQTAATFAATLDRVLDMRPDRLAVYGYAHMPRLFKAQRQIRAGDLPDASSRLELLQMTVERLCGAGYVYIGMDHFALPEDSLAKARENGTLHRSFQGYTTHAERDLVSLGVSAIGRVGGLYVQNFKTIAEYEGALARGVLPSHQGVAMSRDDSIRQDVIGKIMCHGSVDMAAIEAAHGIVFSEYFSGELVRLVLLEEDGLVEWTARGIRLTPVGRLLMRNVAMTFDAYIGAAVSPPMSKVI